MKNTQRSTEASSSGNYLGRGRWNIIGLAGSAVQMAVPYFGLVVSPIAAGVFYGVSLATAIYSIATKNDDMNLKGYAATAAVGVVLSSVGSIYAAPPPVPPVETRGNEKLLSVAAEEVIQGITVDQIKSALQFGAAGGTITNYKAFSKMFFSGSPTSQTVLTDQNKTPENSTLGIGDVKAQNFAYNS